ncbi:MAG: hypothetical protein V5A84_04395 [Planctomycetota bacterium]
MGRLRPRGWLLAVILSALAACSVATGADEITRARAGEKFRSAFKPGLELKEREKRLKKVAEEYGATIWADDALWCLTRIDLQRQDYEKALERGEKIFERRRTPSLEHYTRRTFIYQNSRMPAVVWILERHGYRYRRGERGHRVKVFNAVPMTLRADMGRAADKAGKIERALHHYRQAASLSPAGSVFNRSYRQQVKRLEKKLKYRRKYRRQSSAEAEKEGESEAEKEDEDKEQDEDSKEKVASE